MAQNINDDMIYRSGMLNIFNAFFWPRQKEDRERRIVDCINQLSPDKYFKVFHEMMLEIAKDNNLLAVFDNKDGEPQFPLFKQKFINRLTNELETEPSNPEMITKLLNKIKELSETEKKGYQYIIDAQNIVMQSEKYHVRFRGINKERIRVWGEKIKDINRQIENMTNLVNSRLDELKNVKQRKLSAEKSKQDWLISQKWNVLADKLTQRQIKNEIKEMNCKEKCKCKRLQT
jgi:multidrug efflux pump subunit AcrB